MQRQERGRFGPIGSMLIVAASLAVAGFLLTACGGDGQKAASSVPAEQGAEDLRQAAARVVNACEGTARASAACGQQITGLKRLVKGSGPSPQVTGFPKQCSDITDNDRDGLVDWPADPQCASAEGELECPGGCPGLNVPPPTPGPCADGIDNDGDGKHDTLDSGCTDTSDPNEADPQCADGIDNDGDGKTDFPADPGCTGTLDDSEVDGPCADGIDNDGDGKTDFPADSGCTGTLDTSEVDPSLTSLTLSPISVVGGSANSQGTVVLTGDAGGNGMVVALTSAKTSVATVPASVTVPAGATQATSR